MLIDISVPNKQTIPQNKLITAKCEAVVTEEQLLWDVKLAVCCVSQVLGLTASDV